MIDRDEPVQEGEVETVDSGDQITEDLEPNGCTKATQVVKSARAQHQHQVPVRKTFWKSEL